MIVICVNIVIYTLDSWKTLTVCSENQLFVYSFERDPLDTGQIVVAKYLNC